MKKIPRSELSTIRMVAGNEKKYSTVIVDGVIKDWVGFGWVGEDTPTAEQRKTIPEVEDVV